MQSMDNLDNKSEDTFPIAVPSDLPTTETSEGGKPRNAFEDKRSNRVERLRARAEKVRKDGDVNLDRAHQIASVIPPGQPILIGHHSEKRHRRDLERIDSGMSKGIKAHKMADELNRRADAAESNDAIFTEDPEAVDKLKVKIEALEKRQSLMKEVNKRIRAGNSLSDLGISESAETEMKKPDFLGRIGYADYQLKNNNANIRRLTERLKGLVNQASQPEPEPIESGGIRIEENTALNRIQISFPVNPPMPFGSG